MGSCVALEAVRWPSFSRKAFSSLAVRNYRLFFFGQLVSMSGTWMQTVAQSILVLQLTHSGAILGLTIGARFAPLFLFGPIGGVIADRTNKRNVLYVTQALSGLLALIFGLLTEAGAMRRRWSGSGRPDMCRRGRDGCPRPGAAGAPSLRQRTWAPPWRPRAH